MAPKAKFDANDPTVLATISLFTSIGVTNVKAIETARNPKNTASLKEIIDRNELTIRELEEKQGNLILHLAVQGTKIGRDEQDYVVQAVVEGRLKTTEQVTGMLDTFLLLARHLSITLYQLQSSTWGHIHYLLMNNNSTWSVALARIFCICLLVPYGLTFEAVGVVVTPEQVYQSVTDYVDSNVPAATAGWTHLSSVISSVKSTVALRWANTLDVKTAVERVFTERYGPKELSKSKAKVSTVMEVTNELSDQNIGCQAAIKLQSRCEIH